MTIAKKNVLEIGNYIYKNIRTSSSSSAISLEIIYVRKIVYKLLNLERQREREDKHKDPRTHRYIYV